MDYKRDLKKITKYMDIMSLNPYPKWTKQQTSQKHHILTFKNLLRC